MSPLHEYYCVNCKVELKLIVKHKERDKQLCPECGSIIIRKEINKCSYRVRGIGFHQNDHPKKQLDLKIINNLEKEQKLALVCNMLERHTGKEILADD